MTLEEAFLEWMSFFPKKYMVQQKEVTYTCSKGVRKTFVEPAHFDGKCCQFAHFYTDGAKRGEDVPDVGVCDRERAWRKYVRIRDALVH